MLLSRSFQPYILTLTPFNSNPFLRLPLDGLSVGWVSAVRLRRSLHMSEVAFSLSIGVCSGTPNSSLALSHMAMYHRIFDYARTAITLNLDY